MRRWKRLAVAVLLSGSLLLLPTGHATALQVGDPAPTFTLPATTTETISLEDYLGKKTVVLFFYIAAFGRA
jgi:cytochrome oxidase Cu insertion factor (SCO1/SenC/PrrC family)